MGAHPGAELRAPEHGVAIVGLDGLARAWLGDSSIALWVLIALTIWQYCGFPMIVLLAAMEGIPQDVHEAATLDGANEAQRLRRITLPLIRPVLLGLCVLQTIFALKVFDLVWVMTRGGPGQSTDVLGTFLFDEAFFKRKYGYASAVAVAMFVIIFVDHVSLPAPCTGRGCTGVAPRDRHARARPSSAARPRDHPAGGMGRRRSGAHPVPVQHLAEAGR